MSTPNIDVTRESPLDSVPAASPSLVQIKPAVRTTLWVASRFNNKTIGDDGSLVAWNTYTGAISVFKPEQTPAVDEVLNNGYAGELRGLTKYLSERGYIVPKGTNEFRKFQHVFGRQHYRNDILELILLASEDCNFRCQYCYEDFQRGTMKPEVREGIKKMVEKRAAGLRDLTVGWFGGEPLYGFKAIEDLSPFFCEIAEKHSLNYTSHMTTNGYLLTPDVAEKLLAWKVNYFQITIDGLAEQHDKNRPTRDGQGTFHTIFANLQSLKMREEKFTVRLRINYDQNNSPHLEGLLELFHQEFGSDDRFKVAFHQVGKWGGPNDANLAVCGSDEAKNVRSQLQKSALDKGLTLNGGLSDANTPGSNVCYAARPYNYLIGADGKIMKCTVALDKQDHNVVGKLTSEGEMEMDMDKYALWVEPAFQNDGNCRRCSIVPTCQGISCPLIRIESKTRPCSATPKPNLRNELLNTLDLVKLNARVVTLTNTSA